MIDRVVSALRPVTPEILLVANEPDAVHWLPGIKTRGDVHPGAGGMAGVEAALSDRRDAIVIAWDMPFVTSAFVELLWHRARESQADVVVPNSDSPYGFEPFCAFYSSRILDSLTEFLERGGGAARDFIAQVQRVEHVLTEETARLRDPATLFFSVNTQDDLRRARAIANGAQ